MECKITNVNPPHVVVEYWDNGVVVGRTSVRIDPQEDGMLPTGQALQEYLLVYAPRTNEPPLAPNWKEIKQAVEPPTWTPEQLRETFVGAVQLRLDEFATARGYFGIISACSYATSTVEQFATEGRRCVELRDATWVKVAEILAQVETGALTLTDDPTSLFHLLPELAW